MILSRCGEGGARVNVYIVNVEIKATQSGYKACMNFEDNKGQLHEKQLAQEQKASMQSNYLAGFIAVLTALQNPCMLSITRIPTILWSRSGRDGSRAGRSMNGKTPKVKQLETRSNGSR